MNEDYSSVRNARVTEMWRQVAQEEAEFAVSLERWQMLARGLVVAVEVIGLSALLSFVATGLLLLVWLRH